MKEKRKYLCGTTHVIPGSFRFPFYTLFSMLNQAIQHRLFPAREMLRASEPF